LQVRVTLDNHRSVGEQLRVDLLNSASVPTRLTFTDSLGRAWLQVPRPDKYRVRVSGESIQPTTSQEILIDASHPSSIAVLQVKPRAVVKFNSKPKYGAITSTAELAVPDNARKYFHDGMQALVNASYSKARGFFERAIASYPRYDAAYNNLGVIYTQLNEPTEAWKAFQQAVQINDKNPDADRNFSRMLLQEGAYKRAKTLLRKSLVVDPLSSAALMLVASAELAMEQYDEALQDATKVHELPHEGCALAHYIAGQVFEHKRELADAGSEYELYLQESPDGPEAKDVRAALSRVTAAETASIR
jgi:tetratricopeptide (TPR) repeat protein